MFDCRRNQESVVVGTAFLVAEIMNSGKRLRPNSIGDNSTDHLSRNRAEQSRPVAYKAGTIRRSSAAYRRDGLAFDDAEPDLY